MKKFIGILLAVSLIISLFAASVTALGDVIKGEDDSEFFVPDIFGVETVLTFEIEDGKAILVACDKDYAGEVAIPESYNGVPVSAIGRRAFRGCAYITEITIPNTVTSIGEEAFSGCGSITEIVVPESVSEMGMGAFVLCESLETAVLPQSITVIPSFAFLECVSLKNVTVSASITEIGQDSFNGCASLENFSIPASVTSIGEYAFWGCPLNEVIISNNFVYLGERAFVEADISTLRFYSVAQMEKFASEIEAAEIICLCENQEHTFSSQYDITCNECLYKGTVAAPVLLEKDLSSITLKPFDGYEYSIDGVNFGESNSFSGLYVGKEYTLYQRVKAAGGEEPSESASLTVATNGFEDAVINGTNVDFIKIANVVEDKETYSLTIKYTATAEIPISVMTAEDGAINTNIGFVEGPNYAVRTLGVQNAETTAQMFFTVDMYSEDGISQGDALYLYVPNAQNVELCIVEVKKLNDISGKSLINNGGVSILKDMDQKDAQALRFYFSYDTETGNDVIIDGKSYTLKARGFLIANGDVKRDSLVSLEALKTDNAIINVMVTDFSSCWDVIDNGDDTSKIVFSSYVKGIKSENGTYNNTSRIYVKGYVVIEADGVEYVLYSYETNSTVSEIAALNRNV